MAELRLQLASDLLYESVVDEGFAGSNGMLAGRLKGQNADAAIPSEPSSLRVYPAQRDGQVVHLVFRSAGGGILQADRFRTGAIPQLTHFLAHVGDFA
jgi:hypothetical protein